jgi:dTDP-4-dehydrorhamnose reductase
MRVAVTGGTGQLGRQVRRAFAEQGWEVVAPSLAPPEHDVADPAIVDTIAALQPDVVVHTAALTDVDGCARDPEAAFRVNALGTRNVARGARASGAALVYISTNEVFSGEATTPYREEDPVAPINPYGQSKAAGEAFARAILPEHYIVRTAWLFGPGGANFVTKILARAQAGPLQVVCDEFGSPSYAPDVARAIVRLVATGAFGTYHFVNAGVASRYEWAAAVLALAGLATPLTPLTRERWLRPSRVPRYTPLANQAGAALGIHFRPWREALAEYLRLEAA